MIDDKGRKLLGTLLISTLPIWDLVNFILVTVTKYYTIGGEKKKRMTQLLQFCYFFKNVYFSIDFIYLFLNLNS